MHWLTDSWWTLLPSPVTAVLLALAAAGAGAWIGVEREQHEKPVGMRTLTLVSLGAAVFTMAGFAFTSNTGDSGRVAAQVVTGIGFLGAGVILHGRRAVSGATTAATIWVTAAIGLTTGAGFPLAGLGLSLLVRWILIAIRSYEQRHVDRLHVVLLRVTFLPEGGKTRAMLARMLADEDAGTAVWRKLEGAEEMVIRLEMPMRKLREMVGEMATLQAVTGIEES